MERWLVLSVIIHWCQEPSKKVKSSPFKRQLRSFNRRLGKHLHLARPCQHEQPEGFSSLKRAGAGQFTACRLQSDKVQSGKTFKVKGSQPTSFTPTNQGRSSGFALCRWLSRKATSSS